MGAELVKFSIVSFPGARAVGKSVRVRMDINVNDTTIEDLWKRMAQDGSLDILLALPGRYTQSPDTVGWMGDFQPGDDAYTYLAGVLMQPGIPVPDGFISRDVAACEMAVGWIRKTEGDEGGDMMANASEHINKAMQEHGYEYDGSNGFYEMEYYSYARFRGPAERGEEVILDFYSPCKKTI